MDLIVQHYSYALFPMVTKGGLVAAVPAARGSSMQGRHVGYCDLTQGSVGAQAGAQTFSELLVFANKGARPLQGGPRHVCRRCSAVVLKTGVTTDASFIDGVAVVVSPSAG